LVKGVMGFWRHCPHTQPHIAGQHGRTVSEIITGQSVWYDCGRLPKDFGGSGQSPEDFFLFRSY
jgi:hypothetical protein